MAAKPRLRRDGVVAHVHSAFQDGGMCGHRWPYPRGGLLMTPHYMVLKAVSGGENETKMEVWSVDVGSM